jgi:hypothetical protein
MRTVTWSPGSDKELDQLFDFYREQQYNDLDHRLRENYTKDFYKFCIAFTIAFNDDNQPEICSSIASRDCWPAGAFRIMNRLWKTKNYRINHSKFISQAMVDNANSQIEWLATNTDCKLYFISRQTSNWMRWTASKFSSQYGLDFKIAPNKYLTCPNECDATCWQSIIYSGDDNLLLEWKSR